MTANDLQIESAKIVTDSYKNYFNTDYLRFGFYVNEVLTSVAQRFW